MQSTFMTGALTAMLIASTVARAADDEDLEHYFAGMRERRLHRLAESYGHARLGQPNLPVERRVEITLELARTYADHATQSSPDDEEARWDQARDVLGDLLDQDLSLSQRLMLQLQWSLVDLARGETNRWRYDLLPHDAGLGETARASLRSAITRFDSIREAVQGPDTRRGASRSRDEPQLSLAQRRSLLRSVDQQQARALMNLGQTYAAGSADRLDALNRAAALLAPLAKADDDLAWPSIVDLAECQRLMGNLDQAEAALDELWDLQPPDAVLDRALALSARLRLDRGDVESALALLEDHRRALTEPSDELEFLLVETLVAKWRRLGTEKSAETDELRERVTNLIRQLYTRASTYWARRAELLLARDVRQGTIEGGIPLLVSTAEGLYRSHRFIEAAEVYGQASRQAEIRGHTADAFDLGFTRAAVLTQAERFADASEAFRTLAIEHPVHVRSPEAHLMSAYTRGRLLAAEPTPENQQSYRRILEEHVTRFESGPTTGEARWLLGRLEESLGRFREAAGQYRRVPLEHARATESLEAAGRCFEGWMAEARQSGQSADQVLTEAAGFFQQVIRESRQAGPDSVARLQLPAALRLARLWLNATPPRYREAERVLERLLVGSASAEASGSDPRQTRESLREARQLLIVALAGQGRISDAERQLRQMAQGDTDESVQLLQALDDVGLSAEPAVQRALGELQLKLLETLRAARPRLSSTGRFRLDLAEARALARVGKTDQALKAFDQLRAQRPDDLDLLIAQGDLLMSLDRKETYPAAAETWRKLESLSPPTSPLWYRARYNLALTYYNLGDRARCHKLIGVTRLLYPEMGGPDLRLKFDELWRRSRPEG